VLRHGTPCGSYPGCPRIPGSPSVRRRRRIEKSLERSSFTADASTGVGPRQRRSQKKATNSAEGGESFFGVELWKVALNEDKIAGTSTGKVLHSCANESLVVGSARVSHARGLGPWATLLQYTGQGFVCRRKTPSRVLISRRMQAGEFTA